MRVTRTVPAAHHRAVGRVVIHPTVSGSCRLLWHDVLPAVADGKPPRASSRAARGTEPAKEYSAHAALKAAAVHQLTLLRAHRRGLGVGADPVALHQATGTDVITVHHAELPADLAHLLHHCDHRIVDSFTAMAQLHPPAPELPTPGPAASGIATTRARG
ncbi:hypothetical protein [Streptomyces sp. OR43]|uniref:hypothetical protein n=1 Tax=Streptomyces sp. or43 TaxID=2478957 RepID=UPI0011CD9F90|nr:hypothetical protein [Streptomyces sp. or43]TXS40064.1 hypothetical protein EAO72_17020 [Streptomyces sp. or43]